MIDILTLIISIFAFFMSIYAVFYNDMQMFIVEKNRFTSLGLQHSIERDIPNFKYELKHLKEDIDNLEEFSENILMLDDRLLYKIFRNCKYSKYLNQETTIGIHYNYLWNRIKENRDLFGVSDKDKIEFLNCTVSIRKLNKEIK